VSKQQILEAAAQIFSTKGYHATSMQDIANAVNLKKASLYHHISSKQDVLIEILDQALDMVIEQVSQATQSGHPTPEKLRRAMGTYLNTLADHRELAAVLLLEYRSLDTPQYKDHITRRDRFENLWRDLILEGQELGIFDCPDPAQAARALLGLMNWTITWYHPQGSLSASEIADQYTDLLLHGLLQREA
jgi:TetR/AcrR family transcriptional regulator, cholesterol catabolism regulator